MSTPLLEVKNLKTYIHDKRHRRLLRIVDGVSFQVNASEALGIFGESGSGKSSVAYSIMGLMPENPGIVEGEIWLNNGAEPQNLLNGLDEVCTIDETTPEQVTVKKNVSAWKHKFGYEKRMEAVRGKQIALIPQSSKTALWPFGTIEQQIRRAQGLANGGQQPGDSRVSEILHMLKLNDMAQKYPHQLSGGACQRALIGMTLALEPTVVIADEPTTGLDTTLQVNIIGLLNHFKRGKSPYASASEKEEGQRALIVISHDLRLMQKVADRIVVMYAGEIVESGDSDLIRSHKAAHPYTQQLLNIADITVDRPPTSEADDPPLPVIEGDVPTLLNRTPGCKFYPRCPIRIDKCRTDSPQLLSIDNHEPDHKVSCHVVASEETSGALTSHP